LNQDTRGPRGAIDNDDARHNYFYSTVHDGRLSLSLCIGNCFLLVENSIFMTGNKVTPHPIRTARRSSRARKSDGVSPPVGPRPVVIAESPAGGMGGGGRAAGFRRSSPPGQRAGRACLPAGFFKAAIFQANQTRNWLAPPGRV
jgi:hypothetical protein